MVQVRSCGRVLSNFGASLRFTFCPIHFVFIGLEGFRVQSLGFGIQGLGFSPWGLESEIVSLGIGPLRRRLSLKRGLDGILE